MQPQRWDRFPDNAYPEFQELWMAATAVDSLIAGEHRASAGTGRAFEGTPWRDALRVLDEVIDRLSAARDAARRQ